MPRIPTYDAGDVRLQPTETGIEATAGAARRVGMFYNQSASAEEQLARETERLGAQTAELGAFKANLMTGEGSRLGSAIAAAGDAAVKANDHAQINHGAATYAAMLQGFTQQWNDIVKNADPNDTTVAQKFMTDIEPQLQKFRDGMYTEGAQDWATAHINALRQHFAEKTTGDMATLAGQAAVVNMQDSINSLSATVHSDPSSIKFAIAALKSSTEGMLSTSPNLSGVEAGRARTEILQKGAEAIVKSAAVGYIERTAQLPPWLNDPSFSGYVNGAELHVLQRQAQVQARMDATAQKQAVLLQKQIAETDAHAAFNKNFSDNVSYDQAANRMVIKPGFYQGVLDITKKYGPNAPDVGAVAKSHIDWGESQQRERAQPIVTDKTVQQSLYDGLFSADKPTTLTDILSAEAKDKLSAHDAETLRQLHNELEQAPLKGPVWADTMKAAQAALTYSMPGIPGKDPKGEQAYASFVQQFIPQYIAASRGGKLPPNALDLNDPQSLISKSLAQFKRSPAQMLKDHIEEMGIFGSEGSGLPPLGERKAGETYPTPRGPMKWTGTGWTSP